MNELIKIILGSCVLLLGVPIGNILRKYTKDEMKDGRKWFKLLTLISLLAGIFGIIINRDWVMFTFFFISIVTSRSLILKK